jgi:hypothetical protein
VDARHLEADLHWVAGGLLRNAQAPVRHESTV